MALVNIPYPSFISEWEICCDWLIENVGEQGFLWKADNCEYLVDHAQFWFWREEDAIAFKIRWL